MRPTLIAITVAALLPTFSHASQQVEILHRNPSNQAARYVRLQGVPLPGFAVAAKTQQHAVSSKLLRDFAAPVFELSPAAARALDDAKPDVSTSGAQLYKWQQHFDGIPVWRGTLTALVDASSQLRVLSGQPAKLAPSQLHARNAQAANLPLQTALTALRHPLMQAPDWQNWSSLEWRADLPQTTVRAQAVYADHRGATVPAWRFEIELSKGRSSTLHELVISQAGELIAHIPLTREASYRYLVYAGGDGRPFDSPYGDLTPLPANFTDPVLASAGTFTVEETASDHSTPWLPINSSELLGNHVDIYLDTSGNNGFDASDRRAPRSAVGEFIWPFTPGVEPLSSPGNQNAAMVQAFYVANWLHDYFYDAGFTTRTAEGADRLLIELNDSSGSNNANISVPGDGQSPRMQVFLFDGATERRLELTGSLSGLFDSTHASFGPNNFSVSAPIVIWNDGVKGSDSDPDTNDDHASIFDGCETHPEPAAIAGKIALIDRGWCKFQEKVAHAEQAGAVGAIIANHLDNSLVTMAAVDGGPNVTIGSLFIGKSDGASIRNALQTTSITADMRRTTGVDVDGGLDSALVAHEWGHYLVGRLVSLGSGSQSSGLNEGWADFVALFALSATTDGNTDMSGRFAFSGYALSDFLNGFRRFPYSADFSHNALNFRHISNGIALPDGRSGASNSEEHNTGEIWASALWDAYVALVRNRGHAEAQNRMRRYLVQALKLTPADPDFIEARDAQLDAVTVLQPNDAGTRDFELFRQAFARRGLGINAQAPLKTDETQVGTIESFVWTVTALPQVNAGPDQSVISETLVNLTGAASDADGAIASLRWTQLGGPLVTLASNNAEQTSFLAPAVNVATTLTFELTASDNAQEKASDQVSIIVSPISNAVPSVNAGADQSVISGSTVTLSGTASDSDGTITSYRWSQLSGTAVTLNNSSTATATFTAPTVNADTLLVFQLAVTDNGSNTAIDTLNVTVRSSTAPPTSGGGGGGGSISPLFALLVALTGTLFKRLSGWRRKLNSRNP